MKKPLALTALLSSAVTLLAVWAFGMAPLPTTVKLDNARVTVKEVVYLPGVPRERSIRSTDQVIVFLDDCKYQRIDSETHEKTVREHKSGDVIWHNKGEDAPVLTNLGTKPYRTLVVQVK